MREICPERCYKACQLAVWSPICSKKLQGIVKLASALESGRYVARDIGKSSFLWLLFWLNTVRYRQRHAPPVQNLLQVYRANRVTFSVEQEKEKYLSRILFRRRNFNLSRRYPSWKEHLFERLSFLLFVCIFKLYHLKSITLLNIYFLRNEIYWNSCLTM